jgi:SAM-dependent methyltransferase
MSRAMREQAFHDAAYSDARRDRVTRFYTVVTASRSRFAEACLSYARTAEDVLEYGCGQGSLAVDLAREGARVKGIDISPVAIEQSRNLAEQAGVSDRVAFDVMDAEHLTFDAESFDLVCGTAILHHLDLATSYAEIARVLRPDGRALFLEPLGHNPMINWYRDRTPELRTPDETPLRDEHLRLADRSFAKVDVTYFELMTLTAFPLSDVRGFDTLVRGLGAIDRGLFKIAPPLRKHAWFAILELSAPRADGRPVGL